MKNKKRKIKTGIDGLDKIFYGGINLNDDAKGLVVVARGEHGVNKIHLAMQMCEGLRDGFSKIDDKDFGKHPLNVLIVSLNKDTNRLSNTYYDFYIQRLIRTVQTRLEPEVEKEGVDKLNQINWEINENYNKITEKLCPKLASSSESGNVPLINQGVVTMMRQGIVYYSDRTHGIHLRCQENNRFDDLDTILLGRNSDWVDSTMEFWGKESWSPTNSLVAFRDMIKKVEKIETDEYCCILIDGLSRLTSDEIEQCPLRELSSLLHEKCKVGLITADEKINSHHFDTDILIDMQIKEEQESTFAYYALKISKCLYQKNVYGWHRYKMRNFGIEVIPSLKLQLSEPYHYEDSIAASSLTLPEAPFRYWINANKIAYGKIVNSSDELKNYEDAYADYHDEGGQECKSHFSKLVYGKLIRIESPFDKDVFDIVKKQYVSTVSEPQHRLLYIDLNRDRLISKMVWSYMVDNKFDLKILDLIHCCNINPGYIHADEFLYLIDQFIQVVVRLIKGCNTEFQEVPVGWFYRYVHLVIGDINRVNFEYPYLNHNNMWLPAISEFTKKHKMRNYIFSSFSCKHAVVEKERFLDRQLSIVAEKQ